MSDLPLTIQELEQLLRARDEFLSIASHELRTPLTAMKLQMEITKRSLGKRGPREHWSTAEVLALTLPMEKQVNRLCALLDDMLDVSRIGKGELPIRPQEVDLCVLVREVLERLEPQMMEAKSLIHLDCPKSILGHCDRARMEQVLVNLLTNAFRYGNGQPISICLSQRGEEALLSVRDQGPGIAKEDQERIFNLFERGRRSSDFGGLGLGLYIARNIVERHGGQIRLESEPGAGATFIVRLPLGP
jgi:signal transduction histidine kinase